MVRRKIKKRTHVGAQKDASYANRVPSTGERIPKSMVLRMGAGEVGPSVSQLVKDVRAMMEPNTASRLKERRSNKLKDYTTMAGPLGVSHLLLFSRSSNGNTNLRIALAPRGPTFFFQVESYSLCKDVKRTMKHPKGSGKETLHPPLLVMNNFLTQQSQDTGSTAPLVPKHLESLTTSMFQSLFPSISPQDLSIASVRRVLLLDREPTRFSNGDDGNSFVLNLRHYGITTRPTGISRGIRRLRVAEKPGHAREKKKRVIPNLGRLDDVADYFLDASSTIGYTSASESEAGTDAEVEVLSTQASKPFVSRKPSQPEGSASTPATATDRPSRPIPKQSVEKRAVKLDELGPRMRLRLIKVEEGLCSGRVMWHDYMSKTKDEVREMERSWDQKLKDKEERRKVQQENVERKRKERDAAKKAKDEDDLDGADADVEGDDDADLDDVFDDDDNEDAGGEGWSDIDEMNIADAENRSAGSANEDGEEDGGENGLEDASDAHMDLDTDK